MTHHLALPPGVMELAASTVQDAVPLLQSSDLNHAANLDDWLGRHLTAPLTLDADVPSQNEPTAAGGGWVQCEIIEDDRALFETVLDRYAGQGAEAVAAASQELRLPVCPYRNLPDRSQRSLGRSPVGPLKATAAPTRSLVIDMTTHWAGPLACGLLAEAGATVIKVDPDCRPDGFRSRPGLYRYLNGAKEIVNLDLRVPAERDRFDSLVAEADLLVESFSRRVMSNLGYSLSELKLRNPLLRVLSIKAYPHTSVNRNWLAFGSGVHATSGLAFVGCSASSATRPGPSVPTVAYPDFLTGLAGFTEGLRLLTPGAPHHREVTLAGAIQPLVDRAIANRGAEQTSA